MPFASLFEKRQRPRTFAYRRVRSNKRPEHRKQLAETTEQVQGYLSPSMCYGRGDWTGDEQVFGDLRDILRILFHSSRLSDLPEITNFVDVTQYSQ
jgi:hypothetical protein